jgi:hypothetical protein
MEGKKQLTLTVGITTRYGTDSLIDTARSIYASQDVNGFEFIIVSDNTPIKEETKNKLENMGVKIIWNDTEGSQLRKIKQIINMCKSDVLIITQDDISFDKNAVRAILDAFEKDPELTMVGLRVLPLPPKTFFGSFMTSMLRVVDNICMYPEMRQNHLAVNGRCLAYRTDFIKKFNIDENVVTSDMYMYLLNEQYGGKFARPDKAIIYIRTPQKLKDQIGPSSRYQHSSKEMIAIFGDKTRAKYKLSKRALLGAATKEFIENPLQLVGYVFIYVYTRIMKRKASEAMTTLWAADTSTKNISVKQ